MFKALNRISAFLLDILLISFLTISVSSLAYLNPYKYEYEEMSKNYTEKLENIMDDLDNIEINNLVDTTIDMFYDLESKSIFISIYYLVFTFLYFTLFQYFNDGQTIGKKVFKLKVVNKNGKKAKLIQFIPRTIFNGSSIYLGFNLIILIKVILLLITTNKVFIYYSFALLSFTSIVLEIIAIVILFKKKEISLDDIISNTKVIDLK